MVPIIFSCLWILYFVSFGAVIWRRHVFCFRIAIGKRHHRDLCVFLFLFLCQPRSTISEYPSQAVFYLFSIAFRCLFHFRSRRLCGVHLGDAETRKNTHIVHRVREHNANIFRQWHPPTYQLHNYFYGNPERHYKIHLECCDTHTLTLCCCEILIFFFYFPVLVCTGDLPLIALVSLRLIFFSCSGETKTKNDKKIEDKGDSDYMKNRRKNPARANNNRKEQKLKWKSFVSCDRWFCF